MIEGVKFGNFDRQAAVDGRTVCFEEGMNISFNSFSIFQPVLVAIKNIVLSSSVSLKEPLKNQLGK